MSGQGFGLARSFHEDTAMLRNVITALFVGSLLLAAGATTILPALTGTSTVTIKSSSMEPNLPISALVFVQPQDTYSVGDIVTFRVGTEYYTHRLNKFVETTETTIWQTQGDANEAPDANPINQDQIVGKAQFYVPYMGFVSLIAGEPAVMAFMGLLALIVLFWPLIWGEDEKSPLPRTTIAEGK